MLLKLDAKETMITLNTAAMDHSTKLVEQAKKASEKHCIDVFILERPPRYDTKDKDPTGVKSTLNEQLMQCYHSYNRP